METIKIARANLLERVRANRAAHVADFAVAFKSWRDKQRGRLWDAYTDFNAADGNPDNFKLADYSLQPPISFEKEYLAVIAMLEMSVDEVIELTQRQFRQYAMDEWDWTHSFKLLTQSYDPSK